MCCGGQSRYRFLGRGAGPRDRDGNRPRSSLVRSALEQRVPFQGAGHCGPAGSPGGWVGAGNAPPGRATPAGEPPTPPSRGPPVPGRQVAGRSPRHASIDGRNDRKTPTRHLPLPTSADKAQTLAGARRRSTRAQSIRGYPQGRRRLVVPWLIPANGRSGGIRPPVSPQRVSTCVLLGAPPGECATR